jgi:hypothetical protein
MISHVLYNLLLPRLQEDLPVRTLNRSSFLVRFYNRFLGNETSGAFPCHCISLNEDHNAHICVRSAGDNR